MKFATVIILVLLTGHLTASQKAATEQGKVVILNDNGTWQYEDEAIPEEPELTINPGTFNSHEAADFVLQSAKTDSTFAINPTEWMFNKSENGEDAAEYYFQRKGADLYAMAITEEIEIDVKELAKIAFENARSAAPDSQVVKKEYRTVNNKQVIYMEMIGTIQSVRFKYLGYYYSNASGSTQLIAYTGVNLVDKYADDINLFLNGFSSGQ